MEKNKEKYGGKYKTREKKTQTSHTLLKKISMQRKQKSELKFQEQST